MATLLGTANLQGAFTASCDSASVVTDDVNRVTQTEYRNPYTIHTGGLGVIETRDFRPIYDSTFQPYVEENYIDEEYFEDIFVGVSGFSSPDALNCAYNFLEVDPKATINSIQVQMTVRSTGNANANGNYGKFKARWQTKDGGFTDSSTQTLTTQALQTLTFTITPDSNWLTYNPTGLGKEHWLRINSEDTYTHLEIFAIRARVNYTGRTRFTTGFKSYTTKSVQDFIYNTETNPPPIPTEFTRLYKTEGYGFSIPSNHNVDGALLKYGFGAVVSQTYPTDDSLHFKTTVGGTHTRVSTNGLYTMFDFDDSGYLSGGQAGIYAREYNAIDEDNTRAEITTAEVNDSTFGMEARFAYEAVSTRPSEPVVFDINIAYKGPISSGDININTVSSTTVAGVLTHGVVNSELEDMTGVFTTTALGGYLLEATATPNSAFTTQLGLAGRIQPAQATISGAFAATMTAELGITASAITFPEFTTTVSGAVERTTPADINTAVTVDVGTAGLTRTGFTVAISSAFVFDSVADIFIIKAVDDSRIFVEPAETRNYLIPLQGEDRAHERTLYIPQQTRRYSIPIQGEDRAHERRLYVPYETRTTGVEAL